MKYKSKNIISISKSLGILHTEILWLHDAKDYNSLGDAARRLFQLLQFDTDVVNKVAERIRECYYLADVAENENIRGNYEKEENTYNTIFKKFLEIEKLLGYRSNIAKFQKNWWIHFRKKNRLAVIYYLLLQHISSFGICHFHQALITTYYLIHVGFGHNKRDKESTIKYATKYWHIVISKFPKEKYPFIG